MTIFDKIENINAVLGNLVFKEFMDGKYDVLQISRYFDPEGTERYVITQQNSLRDHEQDPLFTVVKYPEWYAELKELPTINVDGELSNALYTVCHFDEFEEVVFDKAKELAEKGNVEFVAPDNLKDYKKWYKEHKTKCLEQY